MFHLHVPSLLDLSACGIMDQVHILPIYTYTENYIYEYASYIHIYIYVYYIYSIRILVYVYSIHICGVASRPLRVRDHGSGLCVRERVRARESESEIGRAHV